MPFYCYATSAGRKVFGMPWKFLFEFTIYDRIAIRKNSSNASISAESWSLQQALFVPHFLHAETENLRLSGEETKKAKTSRSSFSEIDEHTKLPFNGFLMDWSQCIYVNKP